MNVHGCTGPGPLCPTCGGLHMSRFHHEAIKTKTDYDMMVGQGDKLNVIEGAWEYAFQLGWDAAKKEMP